ncbi:putative lipoprotein [Leptospira ryugenii]|uniref:Putative lipoprotein n=1 Tax=Leptospira ryugenii TaxID=1917863 RepID=A0A2P2DYW7_9LEPT|nr:hypothetical protein [Leptospira ryugenii]GBF49796.1 putative lipoprotein [Leptospira ryugenii]
MKSISRFSFFAIVYVTFFFGCATGTQTKQLLYHNNNFATYSVKREKIKTKTEGSLPQSFVHPIDITEEKIIDLLGNLKYRRETSLGVLVNYIFDETELKEFASDLRDALGRIKPDEALLVISKYNSVKSVVSHYSRTSFYVFSTEKNVEIVFGEVQKEIEFDEEGNYFDWSRIPEISFENVALNYQLLPSSDFEFRKVNGFSNKRWVVFSKSSLNQIKLEKRKKQGKELTRMVDKDIKSDSKEDDDAIIQD